MQLVREKITLKYDDEGRLIEQITTTEYKDQPDVNQQQNVYFLPSLKVN